MELSPSAPFELETPDD